MYVRRLKINIDFFKNKFALKLKSKFRQLNLVNINGICIFSDRKAGCHFASALDI